MTAEADINDKDEWEQIADTMGIDKGLENEESSSAQGRQKRLNTGRPQKKKTPDEIEKDAWMKQAGLTERKIAKLCEQLTTKGARAQKLKIAHSNYTKDLKKKTEEALPFQQKLSKVIVK